MRDVYDSLRQGGLDRVDDQGIQLQRFRDQIFKDVTGPMLEEAEAQTTPLLKAQAVVQAIGVGQRLDFLSLLAVPDPKHRAGGRPLRQEEIENLQARQNCVSDLIKLLDPAGNSRPRARP